MHKHASYIYIRIYTYRDPDKTYTQEDEDEAMDTTLVPNDPLPHEDKKFLVFESCLLPLFALCRICGAETISS